MWFIGVCYINNIQITCLIYLETNILWPISSMMIIIPKLVLTNLFCILHVLCRSTACPHVVNSFGSNFPWTERDTFSSNIESIGHIRLRNSALSSTATTVTMPVTVYSMAFHVGVPRSCNFSNLTWLWWLQLVIFLDLPPSVREQSGDKENWTI